MKKLVLTICALMLTFAAPLAALEWGGLITNDTGIETPDFSNITFKQSDAISVWFKTPIDEEGDFVVSGELLYKFSLTKPKSIDAIITQLFDVTLLKVAGEIEAGNGILSLNAGRFSYVDNTGAIISHTVDGVSVDYAMSLVKIGAFAGYTGLLNSLNGTVYSAGKNADFYDLSYGFAPLGVSVEFPYLPANMSLGIQGFAILDCGDNVVKTNTYYADLALSGPVTNNIYYSLSTVLGSTDFKDLSNFSAASLLVFPTEEVSVNAGVEFGSAADGTLSTYYSVLSSKAGEAAASICPKLGLTYGTDIMCFDLSGKYILGYDYINKKYDGSGAEINTGFVYNIFSDFQVGLSATAFFDATPAKSNRYTANLNIALAF